MDNAFDGSTYQINNRLASFELSPEQLASLVRELTQTEVAADDIEALSRDTPIAPAKFSSILLALFDWCRSQQSKSEREATTLLGDIFPEVPDFRFVKARHAAQLEAYRRDIQGALAKGSNLAETLPQTELTKLRDDAQTTSLRALRSLYRKVIGDSSELKLRLILNPPEPLLVVLTRGEASEADLEELMRRMTELYILFGGSGLNYELLEVEEFEGAEA